MGEAVSTRSKDKHPCECHRALTSFAGLTISAVGISAGLRGGLGKIAMSDRSFEAR